MDTTLKTLQKIVMFMLLMILVNDIGGAIYTKQLYKGGIDFSAKSASMEIIRDSNYANGQVRIDTVRSVQEFKDMMKLQFSLTDFEVEEGIVFAQPVNTVPSIFTHPITGKNYTIVEPMFIVVFRVRRKGVFIRNDIIIDNLSGSRVKLKD